MIRELSSRIAEWLEQEGAISGEDNGLFSYAVYSLLFGLLPIFIVTLLGLAFGMLREGLLIITPFMLIRKFSGGYHLDSPKLCIILSTGLLTLAMGLIKLIVQGGYVLPLTVLVPVRGGEYYILHENIQQEIYEVVDSLRHRFSDLSLNTKEIFSKCEYMKCPAGHSILAIDVNGYLAPCLLLGNAEKINLTSCSISDIISYYLELNKRNQHNECSNMMGICPGSKIVFNAGKEENINDQG